LDSNSLKANFIGLFKPSPNKAIIQVFFNPLTFSLFLLLLNAVISGGTGIFYRLIIFLDGLFRKIYLNEEILIFRLARAQHHQDTVGLSSS